MPESNKRFVMWATIKWQNCSSAVGAGELLTSLVTKGMKSSHNFHCRLFLRLNQIKFVWLQNCFASGGCSYSICILAELCDWRCRQTEDINQALEDNQVKLLTMKASRFVKAFEHDVDKWERALSLIGEIIEMLLTVQRQWMYLEV